MKTPLHRIFFVFGFSLCTSFLSAQTIEEQMTKSHPNCQTIFMNAMDLLPKLYREKSFDSLHKAFDIWERSCGDMPEVRITRILLDIEEGKFSLPNESDGSFIELLSDYARNFPSAGNMHSFPSYTDTRNSFFKFSTAWARLLLKNKKLNENETFVCKVLSGEIQDPQQEIRKNAQTYPEFAEMLEKNFESKRKGLRTNFSLSTGVWLPTKNLSILGSHPTFGFQIGARNMHHQIDLSFQIRYMYSANTYAVKIDGQLDSTNYYFGGYIGADYTYYLVSKPKYDFGFLAGMGWDGFDFAPQPYNYYYYDPYYSSHVTIGSFNGNAGLRFNYYFTHSFYMGLQARYNAIYYSTHGGSDLTGDAVTIDLIFGFNGSKK